MLSDILITLLLVLLNGFFVAAEFAIVKVRASKIEMQAKTGNSAAILSSHIISHMDGYLAATQLGITLASLGLGWVGEPVVSKIILNVFDIVGLQIAEDLAHKIALPIAFAFITVLHIVFGELAPKSIAIQRAEATTLIIAYPLNIVYWIFKPFIFILNGFANIILRIFGIKAVHGSEVHSAEEIKFLIEQTGENDGIESNDFSIIKNAFDFSGRTVKQIMIPRMRVVAIDVNHFTEEVFEKLFDEGYSRIPCYENTIDNVTGIIYLKDILSKNRNNEPFSIKDLVKNVIIVPENKRIGTLLKEFQIRRIHLAVVIDEFGGMEGIVTMEDILEELVGEIQDEFDDEAPIVVEIENDIFNVVATATVYAINHHLPLPISEENSSETLAGVIIEKMGTIPDVNEKVLIDGYEITILKRLKNSVSLVQLKKLPE